MTRIARAHVGADIIDQSSWELAVADDSAGAVVSFSGVVRIEDCGRGVTALAYEAHPQACVFLDDILSRFARAHPELTAIAAVHRTGDLRIGDLACVVAVSSPHRSEAFAGCSELIDTVKAELPIWKLQTFITGDSEWVNAL
ncbi:MAG: molybdenum cofactor biosynthesis protein MoaE [Propionibacteriaceae bacterium]|jgi:molybdopterin synthase catalytic subunit|nr:molybdenum cofactor biosynthesis protein MoaE [Propionibacteriaceae bacterium]